MRLPFLFNFIAFATGCFVVACTERSAERPAASEPGRKPGEVRLDPVSVETQTVALGDLPEVQKRGVLRILVPPRDTTTLARSNSSDRLERDLAAHFAERFEIDAQIVEVAGYEDLIPKLLEGRGDIVAGQMTVTKLRAKQVAFTRPTDTVSEILVGSVDEEKPPLSVKELEGATICVPGDSSYLETLRALQEEVAFEIAEVSSDVDPEQIAYEVSRGERRLTVLDSNRLEVIEQYNQKLRRLFALRDGRQLAWAVRPDNPKLKAAADAFLVEAALTSHAQQRSVGDLEDLKERGSLRLITRNNAVNYYLHRGQHLGFDYELTKLLADSLGLRLEVVVPPRRDELIPYLLEGKGDIIAASLTVSPEREKRVRFSEPYLFIDEVVVQRTSDEKKIRQPAEMKGRTIHVRKSSSYYETLSRYAKLFDFKIVLVDEAVETEQLVAQVASGEIDLTVADTHILGVVKLIYDNIEGAFVIADFDDQVDVVGGTPSDRPKTEKELAAYAITGRPGDAGNKKIAFALRPSSTKLAPRVDRFVQAHFRGLEYNMLRNRYFGNQRRANEATVERSGKTGELSPYDGLIKKYSEKYELDWRLMAALAYQESRFDPKARSWVGAMGLFQVMPATGRELGFKNLLDPEESTHAGVKYVHYLIDRFEPTLEFRQRVRFALASYNAGYGHVEDARRLAAELGLNPDRWFKNVEKAMLLLQQPRYYRRARYGFVRGQEPVKYVSQIQLRYDNYVKILPR
ncbi:MAG: transporter substrate-binding domain-containing protein [Myxococcota bacterium]